MTLRLITHTEEEKVDKEEDADVLFLSTESQPERDKNQDAQRSIQTNILFQEERLERGDNLQSTGKSYTKASQRCGVFVTFKTKEKAVLPDISGHSFRFD